MAEMRRVLPLLCLAGLAFLVVSFARSQGFNYDERAELHAVWHIAQGHKPFHDFLFPRPPFFWLLYAPLMRAMPPVFETLIFLRIINSVFSIAALGALLALLAKRYSDLPGRVCVAAAVTTTALLAPVLPTLAQFRTDHLALALSLLGVYRLDRPAGKIGLAGWGIAGGLFAAGFLLTPKLVFLYAGAFLIFGWNDFRRSPRSAGVFFAAAALSAAAMSLLALAGGINVFTVIKMAIGFHMGGASAAPYRFALGRQLLLGSTYHPLLLGIIAASLVELVLELREKERGSSRLPLLFIFFIIVQCLWVNFIWDQFLYTVVLLLSVPLTSFLHRTLRAKSLVPKLIVFPLFLAGLFPAAAQTLSASRDRRGLDAQGAVFRQLSAWAPSGYPVAMQSQSHLVFRSDSTFSFTHLVIPRGRVGANSLEDSPEFGPLFSAEGILKQLEDRPPSLILMDPVFTGKKYAAAVARYAQVLHKDDYEERLAGGIPVLVRRRLPAPPKTVPGPFVAEKQ